MKKIRITYTCDFCRKQTESSDDIYPERWIQMGMDVSSRNIRFSIDDSDYCSKNCMLQKIFDEMEEGKVSETSRRTFPFEEQSRPRPPQTFEEMLKEKSREQEQEEPQSAPPPVYVPKRRWYFLWLKKR